MVAGLARVRRLDAKVRRLVRAAYADDAPGMVLTDLGEYAEPVPRLHAYCGRAYLRTCGCVECRAGRGETITESDRAQAYEAEMVRYVPRQEIGWLPLRSRGPFS